MAIDSSEMRINVKSDNISSNLIDDITRPICVTGRQSRWLASIYDCVTTNYFSASSSSSFLSCREREREEDTRKQLVVSSCSSSFLSLPWWDEQTHSSRSLSPSWLHGSNWWPMFHTHTGGGDLITYLSWRKWLLPFTMNYAFTQKTGDERDAKVKKTYRVWEEKKLLSAPRGRQQLLLYLLVCLLLYLVLSLSLSLFLFLSFSFSFSQSR